MFRQIKKKDIPMTESTNVTNIEKTEKIALMTMMSHGLRDAAGVFAAANDMSLAQLVRGAIAEAIGYSLADEPRGTRKIRKYANAAERIAAQKVRVAERRSLANALLDMYRKGVKNEAMTALEDSLKKLNEL